MHRVVPELIIENYRAGRYSGRFPAVGMFLDLSGFSTMTDTLMQQGQHGAEVLAGMMHSVFDPLVESILNYGGKIIGFAGDGIMALYPIDSDATAKRIALSALASAWEIQQRLAENPGRQTVYGRFQFSVKIGLTVGEAVWGILPSNDGENATYFFRGSAVDDSASAEHQAGAGEVMLTDEMNELAGAAIRTRPVGSFHRFGRFRAKLPRPMPTIFPPVDLEIARIFMPEAVIAQDVRGEFRQIVNLFMRFPDLADEKLHEFVRIIFELEKQYGGLISRLDFGDKGCNMLVLWGAPVAHENDIGRALNFILGLQSRVDFPLTAGVTYYVAHAGYLGSAMYEDYTCYGWGVNLASRFMMSAPDGQVWVDDRITRRVSRRFDIENLGSQRFKGFSAEQRVNLLRGRKAEAELIYQGELIGREDELARLEKFTEPLWKGEFAGLMVVMGDAGIGKGRLVYEFQHSAVFEKHPASWALCQSDQILRQSFNPFRSWLFRYFGFSSAVSADERERTFNSTLDELIESTHDSDLARDLERLRSVLGALVDLSWQDSLYEQLDAEGRYNNTLLALIALIRAESQRQPLILFIEDAQYIDADTSNFLPRLKRSLVLGKESYPVAIIANLRPEGSSPLLEGDLADTQILLKGLATEQVARLIEVLLGGVPAVELVRRAVERSEGNPYFVEQIIRYMQDENLIEISKLGWNQVRRVRDLFLPGDIRALLVARLDQLSHKVKDVVHTASVLGREFAINVLAEMTNEADEIERHVTHAEQHAIWARKGENLCAFTHGLLRDAAYTMQMRARRRELHNLAVDALEKIYGEDIKFHYAELAHHAERAELPRKARDFYTLAGKSAGDAYQNMQAIEYFTSALALTTYDDLGTQFDLLAERAELFNRIGERASQSNDLDALEKLARQLGDHARLARTLMLRTVYHFMIGNYLDTISDASHAEVLSGPIAETDLALFAQTTSVLALLRLGRLQEAMQRAQNTLQHARNALNRKEEARVLGAMGMIALELKEPSTAEGYLVQALEIARSINDRALQTRALNNLAMWEGTIEGDYATAHDYYQQSYKIACEIGDRNAEEFALANLGYVAGMKGDLNAARAYQERALSIACEVGNRYQEMNTLINLSAVAGLQTDLHTSKGFAEDALELARRLGDRSGEAWALLYLGHACQLMKEYEKARQAYNSSVLIRNELDQPNMATEPSAGLIEMALALDDVLGARQGAENILMYLANGGTLEGTEEPLRIYYACYLALEKMQDSRASAVLQSAVQLLDRQLSKLRDEQSRRMYVENVPWRLSIQQAWQEKIS